MNKLISGELLTGFNRVTIAVPAIGSEDGIPFSVNGVWDATGSYPAWADVTVGGVAVRINPDIIEAPYFRLADCLFFAFHRSADLPRKATHKIKQRLGETDYLFWRDKIGARDVVMVDTYDRLLSWC